MNTLSDLRHTLDQRAEQVHDGETVARAAAVRHRVVAVRRRRRSIGASVLGLALLAGVGAVLLPHATRGSEPSAPVVFGEQAPTTMHALGYAYRTDGSAQTGTGRVVAVVKKSAQPQLYSWTADQATEVTVHVPDNEVWDSVRLHFRDFVVVPPGSAGRLSVNAAEGQVAVTRYTLTDATPAGYTRGGVTYRQSVAGRDLLGATIAAPGRTESTTDVVSPGGQVEFAPLCTGVPAGYDVLVMVNGKPTISGDCSDPTSFDPGGVGGYRTGFGSPGRTSSVSVLLTKGLKSTTPVTGDFPHLRLGIGVYGPLHQEHVAGTTVDSVVEHGGHTWTLDQTSPSRGAPLHLPGSAVDRVASLVWSAGGAVRVRFGVEGETAQGGAFASGPGSGSGAMGDLWVPADRNVSARLAHDKGPFAVALYQRDD